MSDSNGCWLYPPSRFGGWPAGSSEWRPLLFVDHPLAACREPKGRLDASPGGLLHFRTQCDAENCLYIDGLNRIYDLH